MSEYNPQVWRVNVRQQSLKDQPVTDPWRRLGGRGLLARILLDEVDATCDRLGPENKLIFAPGLLVGHMLSSTDRISVSGKSPLTRGIKESNAGGRRGLHMTHIGIHALIIEDEPEDNGYWILHLSLNGARWQHAISLIGPGGEMWTKAAGIQNLAKDRVPSGIAARGGLGTGERNDPD